MMYLQAVALLFAASGVKATVVLAQRAPLSNLIGRDVIQGWSLQSSAAVPGLTSCGSDSYCPSSLHCGVAANDEVAACCSSTSDCRGSVEGSPACADSSWNLYAGYMGNGFCCEGGLVGAYDTSKSVAGTCVAAGDVGSLHTAVLTSSGTGASATSAASSASSSASSTSSALAKSSAESSSKSASSAASVASTATTTTATSSGTSSTGSATSSSATASSTAASGAEKVGRDFGVVSAAFLAIMALW